MNVLVLACCLLGSVSGIQTKPMEVDSSGDIWFAIKCTVHDESGREKLHIISLQAVDKEGFEIKTIHVYARIPANGTKVLTTRSWMSLRDFRRIHHWEAED